MAEPNKETVRIALSPAPIRRLPPKIMPSPSTGPASAISRQPPLLTPATAATSPTLQPLPKLPGQEKEGKAINAAASVNRGPKPETARINLIPRPSQPGTTTPVAPGGINSRPAAPVETIPRPLCWALTGISAVIFLIQIWNYVVS
jgi:hypothetical protein